MTQILPLTGLAVGQVHPAVLVCGDPARAARMAARLADAELVAEKREYRSYNGRFHNLPLTVCSHGVGAPGAAIAFEELIAAGARQIVRVGTCGALQPHIQTGDLVVATAAVQHTGYGRETVPEGYPAVADPEVTLALRHTVRSPQLHTGIVLTRDNFYAGVATPHTPDYPVFSQANVLAVEMESAALFLVGSLRQVQTGAVLAVDGNVLRKRESLGSYQPDRDVVQAAVDAAIDGALHALLHLAGIEVD